MILPAIRLASCYRLRLHSLVHSSVFAQHRFVVMQENRRLPWAGIEGASSTMRPAYGSGWNWDSTTPRPNSEQAVFRKLLVWVAFPVFELSTAPFMYSRAGSQQHMLRHVHIYKGFTLPTHLDRSVRGARDGRAAAAGEQPGGSGHRKEPRWAARRHAPQHLMLRNFLFQQPQ